MGETLTEHDAADDLLTEAGAEQEAAQLGRTAAAGVGERIAAMVERNEAEAEQPEPAPPAFAPPHDPRTLPCPSCQGYGEVVTGSLVDQYVTRPCQDCEARGYVEKDAEAKAGPQPGDSVTMTRRPDGGWTW